MVELLTGYLGGKVRPPRIPEAPAPPVAGALEVEVVEPEAQSVAPPPHEEPDVPPAPDPFEVWG